MIEMALGFYPYPPETYANVFAQLTAIVDGDPPELPEHFSETSRDFVARCLHKIPDRRATYAELLVRPHVHHRVCWSLLSEVPITDSALMIGYSNILSSLGTASGLSICLHGSKRLSELATHVSGTRSKPPRTPCREIRHASDYP